MAKDKSKTLTGLASCRWSKVSRRHFIAGVGSFAFGCTIPFSFPRSFWQLAHDMNSSFRVSVITDEISQDFGHALEIASTEFGMNWVELRGMWNKSILDLDAKEVAEARRLLERYQLSVTDIASPLFKVDWPGAPRSKFSPQNRDQFKADFTFDQQNEVLERSLELAKAFQTDRVRCFDFWRLDDPEPYRSGMNAKLIEAARKASAKNVILLLENEHECNTATSEEAARTLAAVHAPNFMLNWDPGNAVMQGDVPYPQGYERLPKHRIGHVHCKDAQRNPDGKLGWAPMGRGVIDWAGQFHALKRDGYHFAVSLETHWRGARTPEESTRQSWAGMKSQLQKAAAD